MPLFEELNEVESRFQQLNVRLCDPAVVADTALYTKLMKEYSTLSPLIEAYRAYCAAQKDEEEAQALLEEGGDRELHELALGQLHEAQKQKSALTETLKTLLLPKDPNDDKNVILEIRGGAGGEEAALFCGVLLRMYLMYCAARGWKNGIFKRE